MRRFQPVDSFINGEGILACSLQVIHKGSRRPGLDKFRRGRCNRAFLLKSNCHETDLSTFGRSPQADTRFLGTHAYSRRSCRYPSASRQGPSPSRRLISAEVMAGGETPAREAVSRAFRPSSRLHLPREFAAVLASPLRSRAGCFELRYCPNEARRTARLGLVVPKRLARHAVLRNRIKRITREVFRQLMAGLPAVDIVIRLVAPADWQSGDSARSRLRVWRTHIHSLLTAIHGRPAS